MGESLNEETHVPDMSFSIATLNVRGLNDKSKRRAVVTWAKKNNIDIL